MTTSRGLCAAAVAVLSMTNAHADDSTPTMTLAQDVTGAASLPVPAVDVVFEASEADKRLTGRVGFSWSDRLLGELKLSAPVSESGDPVRPVTLDGLNTGAKFEVSIGHVWWSPSADPKAQVALCEKVDTERARAIKDLETKLASLEGPPFACTISSIPEARVQEFEGADLSVREALCRRIRADLKDELRVELEKALEELRNSHRGPDGLPRPCVRSALPPEHRAEFDRLVDYGHPVAAALKLELARKKYKFADATTYATDDEKHTGVAVTASIGYVGSRATFSGSFRYERSYEEGAVSGYCLPGTVTGSLICNDLAFGAPKKKQRYVVALAGQSTFSSKLGFAVRLGYDISETSVIVEAPFYFLKPQDGSFTGGVSLGASLDLDSNEIDEIAVVFLGGRFDVLGVNTRF